MSKRYWLFKSDPDEFSIEDLKNSKDKTACWDGVRNYQARNFIRDEIKKGEGVLFYHSNTDPLAITGYCKVVRENYPDDTQFDPKNKHFDSKSKPDSPTWVMVDIRLVKKFKNPIHLTSIKKNPKLKGLKLVKKGNRLSVMPVTKAEWDEILKLGNG
ncbi:MAG: EVE domain-containing protein [Gammaproteobacteria bacterium]|jgi:predicted RNA-binding protein with PUA-like domain|nr:EVE domain-containing protein [Gammaproteobacteria bacterium]HJP19891.1 EVE domain-containing protein [Nitrospinota bacterium]|tara:strand:- start:3393 stop:3863 length:471 start_codon:yes stop_codon:yes gene_type:complete